MIYRKRKDIREWYTHTLMIESVPYSPVQIYGVLEFWQMLKLLVWDFVQEALDKLLAADHICVFVYVAKGNAGRIFHRIHM